jgi:hypothetical protein
MNLRQIVSIALLAASGIANAQSEFDFSYSGQLTTFVSCPGAPNGLCPGADPDGGIRTPWNGTLSFITSSSADGVYSCLTFGCSGDGQLTIVLDGVIWPNWGPPLPNVQNPLALTLLNGSLVSLAGNFSEGASLSSGAYGTDGSALSFNLFRLGAPAFVQFANGTLTPAPEPETWAMLLIGMAATGAMTRRRVRLAPTSR